MKKIMLHEVLNQLDEHYRGEEDTDQFRRINYLWAYTRMYEPEHFHERGERFPDFISHR
jgi:hypothetical protein